MSADSLPALGELDLHLFGEGTHRRLWEVLGANRLRVDGRDGVRFAVWAPNASGVRLMGDFCDWDPSRLPMRSLGASGIFELFVPGVSDGSLYKYEVLDARGESRIKADPMARGMELPPGTASRVVQTHHRFEDFDWITARADRDPRREPLSIYEVHLGSWARVPEEGNRWLGYRELAPRLVDHAKRYGFTHLELLPIMEHPYTPSWGYQVTGYFAPTARYGDPDDLRYFVDHCHAEGIGVILDWVPAHFPRDDFALRRFDGTALFEHEDPIQSDHPDWGTLIFNFGRREVRSFLLSSALYWIDEFHFDGLRVDAVASMLYLDYSRKPGQWRPNRLGGRENLEAIELLRDVNRTVAELYPGCMMIAEESTAWPGVTQSVESGGLGFTFKWNLGWMHDTLGYFRRDSVHRRWHQDDLTFASLYEEQEAFVMPLSHDEVVHGKGSLLSKMSGDEWQRFANLRTLLAYQWTRPGKQLVFMGTELAPVAEWDCDRSLDWHLAADPLRAGLSRFLEDLGRLYRSHPCLWRWDHDAVGFQWIDCSDRENSVLAYLRWDGDAHLVCILNLTEVPRPGYRIGVPFPGSYRECLSSDAGAYGGSNWPTVGTAITDDRPCHGLSHSIEVSLPPLSALLLVPHAGTSLS